VTRRELFGLGIPSLIVLGLITWLWTETWVPFMVIALLSIALWLLIWWLVVGHTYHQPPAQQESTPIPCPTLCQICLSKQAVQRVGMFCVCGGEACTEAAGRWARRKTVLLLPGEEEEEGGEE
jgi:hypothetical protein